ncbi:MAG: 3-dehydroquinate synthase [Proteobacteria bacterium]|nr:3-dehydroquinate synthase [Pseudomonadota bacterium]MBU1397545.1 3-dehydroquinate synthase [Pseudomonadota bacterium]MBU1570699.1 3-dehydroquinate synthase [Pseudomonadota bacterium]
MVKTIKIKGGDGDSVVMIGESLLNLGRYVPVEKTVIITDKNVWNCYGKDFPPYRVIKIEPGEKGKTLDTVREIYERLLEFEVDRSSFIAGIGGGVVCDIAGFAASTFLRGIRFGFVSTTLLSQVDASVGGKNGVNLDEYKNIVGVFNQPEFVICDLSLLSTLPERELLNGFAEIIKHAAICDTELFVFLEDNHKKALSLDRNVIGKLIYDSVKIKSGIVSRDEKEKGERRKLNFGHTFGHAFEKSMGIPHGEAISAGMIKASRLSVKKGLLKEEEFERLKRLIELFCLPVELPYDLVKVIDAIKKDKKRDNLSLHFVFLSGIGSAVIKEILISELD